jgi:hypothetical protein
MKLSVLSWPEVQALAHEAAARSVEVLRWHAAAEATLVPGFGAVCEDVPVDKRPAAIEQLLADETTGPAGYTDMYRGLFWNMAHLLSALLGIFASGSRSEAIESSATRVPYPHLVSWAVARGCVPEAIRRAHEGDDPEEVLAHLYIETQRALTDQLIADLETSHWPNQSFADRLVNF